MKIGVIGTGRIGKHHAEILRKRQVSVAAFDPYMDETWAKRHNIDVHPSLQALMQSSVDALVIASPSDQHIEHLLMAADHNKHVFCEKPIGLDLNDIQKAIDAMAKRRLKLQVGFNRRFDKSFSRLKQAIQQEMGQPHVIKITSRDPACPPLAYVKSSGGIFLDMSIHDLDMARFLADSEVKSIAALGSCLIDKNIEQYHDVDNAVIQLRFANGTMAVIDNSRQAVYGYDQRLEVYSEKQCLKAENTQVSALKCYQDHSIYQGKLADFFLDRYKEAYETQMDAFLAAVFEDKPVAVTGQDGYEAVKLAYAAKRALHEKAVVSL